MNTASICQYCAKPVVQNAIGGLCPECLLKAALASNAGTNFARFTPPPIAELAPHFPQLEILEPIGHGGMGAVYKARQANLNRIVALKILPAAHTAANPGFAERFQREARALARLNHPNIVAVYEFGQTANFHFLIMEFVEGTTLRQIVRTQKLTAKEALQIIPQICEALQFAHDAGIVHRDIKPENILLDKSGRVKIADFGLAKILSPDAPEIGITQAGHNMGTPHYMAPEQIETPSKVDHRADIFSLGVVFYEMLTGELPIGRFSAPSKRAHIDFRLDEIVLRALEKEPALRYQQASQVKNEVQTFSDKFPSKKRPARGFAAATFALLVIVAILAANLVRSEKRAQQRQAEIIAEKTAELAQALQRSDEPRPLPPDPNKIKAQSELSELLKVYTPNHPFVLQKRAEIARAEPIHVMNVGTWRQALATAEKIAALPPEEGLLFIRTNWTSITNAENRKQFLKAFTFASHPRLMAVLDLGLNDTANPVQSWALAYLKKVSGVDFSDDYNAAIKYTGDRREWLLDDVLAEAARNLAIQLPTLPDADLPTHLGNLKETMLREKPELVANSGLENALESIITNRPPELAEKALDAASSLPASQDWYRRVIIPRLSSNYPPGIRAAATQALQAGAGEWAAEPLLAAARDIPNMRNADKTSFAFSIGSALAKTGPKSIPGIIDVIKSDNTYATVYGLGYFALHPLTGVPYDEKHDGNWWAQWWEKNKDRFTQAN